MTRTKILSGPTRVSDMIFDDYYNSSDDERHGKAQRVQIRRWRKLKQQLV